MTRWRLTALVAILAIAVLWLTGTSKTFHTDITIAATPEQVWAVLTDGPGYQAWHPLLVPVRGEFRTGARIEYRMTPPGGEPSTITSAVELAEPPVLLRQLSGIPWILTADHAFWLEPVDGGTRVIQHQVDNGLGILFRDSSWVQPTYERVSQALKQRVEALTAAQTD